MIVDGGFADALAKAMREPPQFKSDNIVPTVVVSVLAGRLIRADTANPDWSGSGGTGSVHIAPTLFKFSLHRLGSSAILICGIREEEHMVRVVGPLSFGLLALAFCGSNPLYAQSQAGGQIVGSCPDGTPDEARDLGFKQVPLKMPQFVRRAELTAAGIEVRVTAHSTPTFNEMDETFKNLIPKIPLIDNRVLPKQDEDLLSDFHDDNQPAGPPVFAFCYSLDSVNWSFTPGVEVSNDATPPNLDNSSILVMPAQTYAVFEYDGARSDIANFRYSLTSKFWPLSTVRRVESPNFEVYPNGDDGVSQNVGMQLWVAVDPTTIPQDQLVTDY